MHNLIRMSPQTPKRCWLSPLPKTIKPILFSIARLRTAFETPPPVISDLALKSRLAL